MAKSSKKSPPIRDARFRDRYPLVWYGARWETVRHVRDGDGWMRPDLFVWVEGVTVVASRVLPPDAPDSALATLLEEALAASRRAPTELRVPERSLHDAVVSAVGTRIPIRVVEEIGTLDLIASLANPEGDDFDDEPRPILDGGAITAEGVTALLQRFRALRESLDWSTLGRHILRFTLRAPSLGLTDGALVLDGRRRALFVERSRVESASPTPSGGGRARETWRLELGARKPNLDDGERIDEATAHGWTDPATPDEIPVLMAWDVDDVQRPLCRADLALASAAIAALARWFAGRPAMPEAQEGERSFVLSPAETRWDEPVDVTIEQLSAELADPDEARRAWIDAALPIREPLPEVEADVVALEAEFRAAGAGPAAVMRRVAARGPEAVAALAHLLGRPTVWDPNDPQWIFPWVAGALCLIADPRALPYLHRVVAEQGAGLEDFLTESLPATLTAFGPAGFDGARTLLGGRRLDPYVRCAGGEAMYVLAAEHPSLRPTFCAAMMEFLDGVRDEEDDAFLVSSLSDGIARAGDEALLARLRQTYAEGLYELGYSAASDVDEAARETPWSRNRGADDATFAEQLEHWWPER